MNREIKFRAWDKTVSKMVEIGEMVVGETTTAWIKNIDGSSHMIVHGESGEFMQYTGLKDKNGKEIYEGDILEKDVYDKPFSDTRKSCKMTMKIVFSEGAYHGITIKNQKGYRYGVGVGGEIIGNIYQNPELLK